MLQNRILLIDEDSGYRERFLDYLRRRTAYSVECCGFAGWEAAGIALKDDPAAAVLLSENLWLRMPEAERQGASADRPSLCLLTEEKPREGENTAPHRIWRYQKMPALLAEWTAWLKQYSVPEPDASGSRTCCIGIWSAGGCGLETSAILQAGRVLAEEQRVLYICFRDFSALTGGLAGQTQRGLSDLLYLRAAGSTWHLGKLVCRCGEMDIMRPVINPEDIWNLGPEEEAGILKELSQQAEYDWILAEAGSGRDPLPMFRLCRKIVLLEGEAPGSRRASEQFLVYLDHRQESSLAGRCVRLTVPPFAGMPDMLPEDESIRFSPLGEWAEKTAVEWKILKR